MMVDKSTPTGQDAPRGRIYGTADHVPTPVYSPPSTAESVPAPVPQPLPPSPYGLTRGAAP